MPPAAIILATTGAALLSARADRKSVEEANELAVDQRQESIDFITKFQKQARGDLFKLFGTGQELRKEGTQAGLDFLGQTIPAQISTFTGGNVAAQNQLIQGQPRFQNAILGRPSPGAPSAVDLSGLLSGLTAPVLPGGLQQNEQQTQTDPASQGLSQGLAGMSELQLQKIRDAIKGFGGFNPF